MRLLIDTNAYSAVCRGEQRAVQIAKEASEFLVPFITLAELRAGFAVGLKARVNEKVLSQFLQQSHVSILFADTDTTFIYASLFAQLRSAGTPIPINDLWIASLALQHALPIFTYDEHFKKIPQLGIFG